MIVIRVFAAAWMLLLWLSFCAALWRRMRRGAT